MSTIKVYKTNNNRKTVVEDNYKTESLKTLPVESIKPEDLIPYSDLPEYVRKLMNRNPMFEEAFLIQNPRYWNKGYIDYLPDFRTEEGYWHGRMFWKYVGWNNGKTTGEELRAIRKKNGVGHNKLRIANAKEEKEQTTPLY